MKLNFKNVTKKFGNFTALDDVSFSVNEGEFVILVGPSGAGKTTVLKLLLQQLSPSSGTIELDGYTITSKKSTKYCVVY